MLWEIDRQNFNMMYEMSTRIVVQKEEALFIQGQPTTYIYLIERGYFGIYVNESQDPGEQQSIIEKKITSKKFRSQTVGFVVKIGMIDKNEFVCEEDMRSNNQFKKYSLVCESKEGVVRQFTKAAFQYFVQSREETREAIAKRLKSKQEEIFDKLDEYYRSYEENKLKLPKIKAKIPNLSVSQSQKQFISNRLWGIPTKNLSS